MIKIIMFMQLYFKAFPNVLHDHIEMTKKQETFMNPNFDWD